MAEPIEIETGPRETILERLSLSVEDLTEMVENNPSLRGMLVGYAAERKLKELWFHEPLYWTEKPNDHDRRKKGDTSVWYDGYLFSVECKSLQSNSVRRKNEVLVAKFQCDASDRRDIKLSDGSTLTTVCLLAGEFDLVAVNCFAFEQEWNFQFAANADLPRTNHLAYPELARPQLLATLMPVTWPPAAPYSAEPYSVLDRLVAERRAEGVQPVLLADVVAATSP